MPTIAKSNSQQLDTGLQSIPTSTPYSQPWWQGLGNNDMPSSGHQEDGPAALHPQGTAEGTPKDTDASSTLQSGSPYALPHLFNFFVMFKILNVLYVHFFKENSICLLVVIFSCHASEVPSYMRRT